MTNFNKADGCALCKEQFPIAIQVADGDRDVFVCDRCVRQMVLNAVRKEEQCKN